ncbi:MAG: MoaD/ThiS family protein [Pseudomonadota bacterium]
MKITFKLYATLQDKLPSNAVNNAVEVDVNDEVTLFELIDQFGVPRESAHLVLINGAYFGEDQRSEPGLLTEGDVVAIWPPVAGG